MTIVSRVSLTFTFSLALVLVALSVTSGPGCTGRRALLTDLFEARRIAADLEVSFAKSAEAGNRAVMAETDEMSRAAAREAQSASDAVDKRAAELTLTLRSLGYAEELRHLAAFTSRFAEYKRLDAEILPLAVENTNLKAQRLLFGPARTASDAFRQAMDAAARSTAGSDPSGAAAMTTSAGAAVLEVQVLLSPHIAEADDAAMTGLEARITTSKAAAREAFRQLYARRTPAAAPHLEAARNALDRFDTVVGEIIILSRRNSNVRSLALSLGRKRFVAMQCEEQLRELGRGLQSHEFTATR